MRTASVTHVRQPLYRKAVARWKNYKAPLAESSPACLATKGGTKERLAELLPDRWSPSKPAHTTSAADSLYDTESVD